MTVKERVGASKFIEFLERLIHNGERMISLIMHCHPGQEAKSEVRFVEPVRDCLQLFFFPPYSSELNPDERAWNDLNDDAVGRKSVESPSSFTRL
jgi:transposase